MFASYKKHNTKLYNKLVELSRNKFFYQELSLSDNFQTRVILIFFHFIVILKAKKNKQFKKIFQSIFDNIFQNIEIIVFFCILLTSQKHKFALLFLVLVTSSDVIFKEFIYKTS